MEMFSAVLVLQADGGFFDSVRLPPYSAQI
jgi:hypothetical protein